MDDITRQNLIIPKVGMNFESEDKAYEMYYRKSQIKRRIDKTISQKHMVCSSQGHQKNESSKGTTRTGCNARVQFSVSTSREGVWTVQKVVFDHNHYLASPNKRQKLRSQPSVQEADRKLIAKIREAGMKPSRCMSS